MQTAGRNFAAGDDFRPAEKISLEIHEARVTGLMKIVGSFEFFRQHLALGGPKSAHHAGAFLGLGCAKVYFDDVGKFAKRYARIVGCEVIKSNKIASRFQPVAGSDDAVLRLNRFQNLSHGLAGRQQRNQILEQDPPSAIHEGALLSAKLLDTIEQGAIESGVGRKFGIGVEVVLDAVSEKDLITIHILRPVKNWLAGNEALSRNRERDRGRDILFGGGGLHTSYIGEAMGGLSGKTPARPPPKIQRRNEGRGPKEPHPDAARCNTAVHTL